MLSAETSGRYAARAWKWGRKFAQTCGHAALLAGQTVEGQGRATGASPWAEGSRRRTRGRERNLGEAKTQGSNESHAANSRARLTNSQREQGPEADRRGQARSNSRSTTQTASGKRFGPPQGGSEYGPRSARNSGEEHIERKKLRRVNPGSGCFEKSKLRSSMHNRQGRRTSKAA
jgi:hypothetical protein